jgi:hypothetical protein
MVCRYAGSVKSGLLASGAVVVAWCAAPPAQGQRVSIDAALHSGDKPYIEAMGKATVSAKPDRALIEIGVVARDATAVAAAAQNAKQTGAVLAELRRLLGEGGKLKTTSYSVRPDYQYPKPGAAPAVHGYLATNIVEITLDDLAQVGKIIDNATQSGANSIQKLRYVLRDSHAADAEALREAAADAKMRAEAIASGLGVKVVRILSAQEVVSDDNEGFAMHKRAALPPEAAAPATQVEAGMIDIEATVMLRVEVEH